jgi:hypothetical protein
VTLQAGEYEATGWTQSETQSLDSAFIFTVTANAGYSVTFDAFSFDYKPQGNGPEQVGAWSDPATDGTGLIGSIITFVTPDNDAFTATQNFLVDDETLTLTSGQTATFYILGYDARNPGRSMRIDNITLSASGGVVPEPSSFAMLAGLGVIGFAATRRRRRA